ncbi:MAG TPA: hypothetical protein VF773_11705 [Verrucomicrobiae bacterium]
MAAGLEGATACGAGEDDRKFVEAGVAKRKRAEAVEGEGAAKGEKGS